VTAGNLNFILYNYFYNVNKNIFGLVWGRGRKKREKRLFKFLN